MTVTEVQVATETNIAVEPKSPNEVRSERYSFTTDVYHQMIQRGILTRNDKIELLEGDLIKMSAVGPRHAACVERLSEILQHEFGRTTSLRHQNPVELSNISEPEPDITILRRRDDFYTNAHPTPDDVLLLIEISESTLAKDRGAKLSAYAKAGIVEYWIVNLQEDLIEVYTNPTGSSYDTARIVHRDEKISPLLLPSAVLEADEVLG